VIRASVHGALVDLVVQVCAVGNAWPPEPRALAKAGLASVATPSTHLVSFVELDGRRLCLKIYRSWERAEPDREWTLLELLHPTGLAPEPVWRSTDTPKPAVAMTVVAGKPLGDVQLDDRQLQLIGDAHALIHGLSAPPRLPPAINSGATVLGRARSFWPDLAAMASDLGVSHDVFRVIDVAGPWLFDPATAALVADGERHACRGDTNPANYLDDGERLRLVDFEDGGMSDPVFEIADMAEHFATRHLPEQTWLRVARATGITDHHRLGQARVIVASFWLALTIRRVHRGLVMRPPVTPSDQARRLQGLLEAAEAKH